MDVCGAPTRMLAWRGTASTRSVHRLRRQYARARVRRRFLSIVRLYRPGRPEPDVLSEGGSMLPG
ncbi:hypothetical protein GCM10007368_04520 [Isoptericola cucumis]|uniref:Uncharacterized protein n=1 Tax=Isoptericola cucumis TaxID=1776856 RepID=A0ABQ2B0T4_9MICO|nr:hypothetical protein GCM10007368_04520 [Isoptericola cucumis]